MGKRQGKRQKKRKKKDPSWVGKPGSKAKEIKETRARTKVRKQIRRRR